MSCPYKNKSFMSKMVDKEIGNPQTQSDDQEKNIPKECPYSKIKTDQNPNLNKENIPKPETTKENIKKDDDDSEDEMPTGGCPVMNKVKKDPVNKHFEPAYEIPRFDQLDFMFDLQGTLTRQEFHDKTQKLRSYPRHLKYSIFRNTDEKLIKLREKEYPIVFFIYDEVKEKGNKMYKKKKFREAINIYSYAYNTLVWLEFKNKERNNTVVASANLDPILDEEFEERRLKTDDNLVEKDSYSASIVFLLLNLSYVYMELRHYKDALDCLNECEVEAGDKVADVFFRRSQVRTYNKLSSDEDFKLALFDIKKAISLKPEIKIYNEHLEILNKIIEKNEKTELERTKTLLDKAQYSFNTIKQKNLSLDQVYFSSSKEKLTYYKILQEMKSKYILAVKFFTETKNEEQIEISYKEIERFLDTYTEFMWFYNFNPENIEEYLLKQLPEDLKTNINEELFIKLIWEFSTKHAEDTFTNAKFNFQLFQYALNKICEDERKEREVEEQKRIASLPPKVSYFDYIKNSTFGFYLSIIMAIFAFGMIGMSYYTNYNSFKVPNINLIK